MTIEQLKVLNDEFNQLEELKRFHRRYEEGRLALSVTIDGFTRENKILNSIVKKHTQKVIEDLEKEIKKRETELESLNILQLNKIV